MPPKRWLTLPHVAVMIASLWFSTAIKTEADGFFFHSGSIRFPRAFHAATALADGTVIITGGYHTGFETLSDSEAYDPLAGEFNWAQRIREQRERHGSIRLLDGRLLITGGYNYSAIHLSSAEVYEPAPHTWSQTGAMITPREGHASVLLPDGKVLVVGGLGGIDEELAEAELYDPQTGVWTSTATMHNRRDGATATLLPNGKVLVAGGWSEETVLSTAEIYDPNTGRWTSAQPMAQPRYAHTATLLPNGKVLFVGGEDRYGYARTNELYDPQTGSWKFAATLPESYQVHTATLLLNGTVLTTGEGGGADETLINAAVYDAIDDHWSFLKMPENRINGTATLLTNGWVLLAGGWNSEYEKLSSATMFVPDGAALPEPPVISEQPVSQTLMAGSTLRLSVHATGTGPLRFQWLRNGIPMIERTQPELRVDSSDSASIGSYSVVVTNMTGSVTSSVANVLILGPPVIAFDVTKQLVLAGGNLNIDAQIYGAPPLSIKWFHNGKPLQGQENDSLTISNVQTRNRGKYRARVSNAFGSALSRVVGVTVVSPPFIIKQPQPATVEIGKQGMFSVTAGGSRPIAYQWFKDGNLLEHATNRVYRIAHVQDDSEGSYSVRVTNMGSSQESIPAFLTVSR